MRAIIFFSVMLFQQVVARASVPGTSPVLIGPAEAEGEVGFARCQHLVKGAFQNTPAVEPVMVVTEAVDAVLSCQFGLRLTRLGKSQVVEAEVCRQVRLFMTPEQRFSLGDIGPLGESFAPPFVIFGNGVVLGEVEGYKSWIWFHWHDSAVSLELL